MTELYIANQRAVLPDGFSVKMTIENPAFEDAGKYTFQIELPLRGCKENLAIFGSLNRHDIDKGDYSWDARLVKGNRSILYGTATVTEYTDSSIKLQLVGGNSEYKFLQGFSETYIDEIELGFSDDVSDPFYSPSSTESERLAALFGTYPTKNFVYLPVYNASSGRYFNEIAWYIMSTSGTKTLWPPHSSYEHSSRNAIDGITNYDYEVAHQPYLLYVIEKIAAYIGLTIGTNEMLNTPLKNLYIVTTLYNKYNARKSGTTTSWKGTVVGNGAHRRRNIISGDVEVEANVGYSFLPHWTVVEFFDQLKACFGLTIAIDDVTKVMNIKFKTSTPDIVTLDDVVDEYSASTDADGTTGDQAHNIGYEFENVDPYEKIDDDIYKSVQKISYDSLSAMDSDYNSMTETTRRASIFTAAGKQFIRYNTGEDEAITEAERSGGRVQSYGISGDVGLRQVNRFRDLVVNTDTDSRIDLKIVPARFINGTAVNEINDSGYPAVGEYLDIACPQVEEAVSGTSLVYVKGLIEGTETCSDNTSKDCIEVAMYKGDYISYPNLGYPIAYPWGYNSYADPINVFSRQCSWADFSLELNPVEGEENMYQYIRQQAMPCDTSVEYKFNFLTDEILDPTKMFMIKNRPYICRSLEYTIGQRRVEKMVTGSFYAATDISTYDPGSVTEVTDLTLSTYSVTLSVGDTVTVTATVTPSTATDKSVSWRSLDWGIAWCENGVITGIAPGTCTVKVVAGTIHQYIIVTVTNETWSLIDKKTGWPLDAAFDWYLGDVLFVGVSGIKYAKVDKWLSSLQSVLKDMGDSGEESRMFVGVEPGTAVISCEYSLDGTTEQVTVTVKRRITSLTLNSKDLILGVGETYQLAAIVTPTNANVDSLVWSSSDSSVVSVSDTGLVTARAEGSAQITVMTEDENYMDVGTVTVEAADTSTIYFSTNSLELSVGQNATIVAYVTPAGAEVTWSSTDSSVASVEGGYVVARSAGTAVISGSVSSGATDRCGVTVS